jgi:hypothetical protein
MLSSRRQVEHQSCLVGEWSKTQGDLLRTRATLSDEAAIP